MNKTPTTKAEKSKEFLIVKNSLLSYYQNIASAQALRLIGFTAGIFTLIGATQISPEQYLRKFFLDSGIFPLMERIPPAIISNIKFLFLFGSIFILFFFVFRAIFRYATFANLADSLMYVKIEETEKTSAMSLHHQLIQAHIGHIKDNPRKVFGMPIWFFYSVSGNKKIWWGIALCIFLSVLATCLILLLLW